jgi:hypothetical protein
LLEVVMTMSPYKNDQVPAGQSIIEWESITTSHIRNYILSAGVQPPLLELQVGTNIVGQSVSLLEVAGAGGNQRFLQEQTGPLIIFFDVAVSFKSASQDQNVPALIFSAWDEAMDRAEYVMTLQTRDNAYDDVEDVRVEVKGFVPTPIEEETGSPDESLSIAVIAGAAVGGAALLILVAFFISKRRNKRKAESQESRTTPYTPTMAVST